MRKRELRLGTLAIATALFWSAFYILGFPFQAFSYSPPKEKYNAHPFLAVAKNTPKVLLVISKDHRMFNQAHNSVTDLDGNGSIDVGFNPSFKYEGYYDWRSCYKHQWGRFERMGLADINHPAATNPPRPPELADRPDIAVPASVYGVCPGSRRDGQGEWHGNWLNYLVTSRMDIIRKVLYGGKRIVDGNDTVLSPSFTPRDSHVWGVEVPADNIWAEKGRGMPYYDLSLYTGFEKPEKNQYVFFARFQYGDGGGNDPLIRVATRVNARYQIPNFWTEIAIWDWVTGEELQPDDKIMPPGTNYYNFNVNVKVCDHRVKGGISPTEANCRFYNKDRWKPEGLLQEHGADDKMLFGLITGASDQVLRHVGGGLRAHVDSFSKSYDFRWGTKKSPGIIDTLDRLRITGWSGTWYRQETAWGAPMGEMVYEALRYFANAPKSHFVKRTSDDFGNIIENWTANRPKGKAGIECVKPAILLISDVYPQFDGDDFPTTNSPELDRIKHLSILRDPPAALKAPFNKDAYLDAISSVEGYANSGRKYFYAADSLDDCSPKPLTSLTQVKGLCPSEPPREGSYSMAAAAWHGHTHNFSGQEQLESPLDFYAIGLPQAYPEIVFDLGKKGKIKILPASEAGSKRRVLGALNYFILDWQTDSKGLPFYIKIVTMFEADFEGADNDRDAMGTFEFALLAERKGSGEPPLHLERNPLRTHVGPLTDPVTDPRIVFQGAKETPFNTAKAPRRFHRFQNYRTPAGTLDYSLPKIEIDLDEVAGFAVTSDAFGSTTKSNQSVGYTIIGTTNDGSYMDVAHTLDNFNTKAIINASSPWPNISGIPKGYSRPNRMNNPRNSPWTCPKPGSSGCGVGSNQDFTYYMTRTFKFAGGTFVADELPNPLWLAAKYGGYRDANRNGRPDPGEWEKDPQNPSLGPANYFQVDNANDLGEQLSRAFGSLGRSMVSGTGSSGSQDAILGGSVAVHNLYYPSYSDPNNPGGEPVAWVGTVFGLFLDKYGNFREDSDGDLALTLASDPASPKGDLIVTFTSALSPPVSPPPCYGKGASISRCHDPRGDNNPTLSPVNPHPTSVHQLKTVWDAGRWLAELDDVGSWTLVGEPRKWEEAATKQRRRRRIYYERRLPSGQMTLDLFHTRNLNDLKDLLLHDNFRTVLPNLGDKNSTSRTLIEWITGRDHGQARQRQVANPWGDNPSRIIWRLGDVLNSKPIIVGPPLANFDFLYGDLSYRQFKKDNATRRQMVYFGANDGMLHAINAGFPSYGQRGSISYSAQRSRKPVKLVHDLGAETWAFIPRALLPRLQYLADKDYSHSYYIDLKPLVEDVKLRGKWRTVIFGGLRLGGRPIPPSEGSKYPDAFYAEVFALDVTDPESEPKLLWSYSAEDLGLMVGLPAVVKSGDSFYAVLPSGPNADKVTVDRSQKVTIEYGMDSPYDGYSQKNARLIVLNAETGIPAVDPKSDPAYLTASEPRSFFNNPFVPKGIIEKGEWSNHVVYFGLTESDAPSSGRDGGAVYRLKMVDGANRPAPPQNWELKRFFSADRPVTGAVNAAFDNAGNLWVVFGTGRMWALRDATPCAVNSSQNCQDNHEQYIYGIKEELDGSGALTFRDLTGDAARIIDVSGAKVRRGGAIEGLAPHPLLPGVGPGGSFQYDALERFLKSPAPQGYRRKLDLHERLGVNPRSRYELIMTQPKIVSAGGGGSNMSVSSLLPDDDFCGGYGLGFMYLLDTFTGLPRPGSAVPPSGDDSLAKDRPDWLADGVFVGIGKPAEVTVIQARGKTIFRTAAADGGVVDIELLRESGGGPGLVAWREATEGMRGLSREAMLLGLGP
ncbi:MAG: hypothetical protein LBO66_12540 [Deltaproteobacteria bacterium]|jgi:type IV pilus assembly protein PilY1|nr:hypothetical protein [Deltaproteobacteria bacterium]